MKKLSPAQVSRLQPEKRKKYEEELRRIKRNKRILTAFIAVIVFACLGYYACTTMLFNVKTVNVTNIGKYYTEQQIIDASEISVGDNYFKIDSSTASLKIEKKLPYVLSAKINKSLLGKVTINITDNSIKSVFEVKDGYALADKNNKVLEIVDEKPEKKDIVIVKISDSIKAVTGEALALNDENEEDIYFTISDCLEKEGLKRVTKIDISNNEDIYIEYQNRYRLHIGSFQNISEKIKTAVKIIEAEDKNNPNGFAEINLTIVGKAYVTPLVSL